MKVMFLGTTNCVVNIFLFWGGGGVGVIIVPSYKYS